VDELVAADWVGKSRAERPLQRPERLPCGHEPEAQADFLTAPEDLPEVLQGAQLPCPARDVEERVALSARRRGRGRPLPPPPVTQPVAALIALLATLLRGTLFAPGSLADTGFAAGLCWGRGSHRRRLEHGDLLRPTEVVQTSHYLDLP